VSYVMAIRCSDTLTMPGGEQRAETLIAAAPSRAWQRLSTGAGAHGPREFDWTRIPVRPGWEPGRGHWLLARRSISDPAEIAYYACYGPRRSSTTDLAWIAGSRWHIEIGHRWYPSSCTVFSWSCSSVIAGFLFGRVPSSSGVVAGRACPALA